MNDRLAVRKTYKLDVNGAFPRSESGRTYEVTDAKGHFLANAAWASRKDARDAVVAARGAFGKWSAMTAYNRGQVLYRVAEVMEGRHVQFCEEVAAGDSPLACRGSRIRSATGRMVNRNGGEIRSASPSTPASTRSPESTSKVSASQAANPLSRSGWPVVTAARNAGSGRPSGSCSVITPSRPESFPPLPRGRPASGRSRRTARARHC